ncbi:chemotaxis protein CheB [Ancylomarina sp. DW003]|nr:chemotaxis protein CheB [Ancylomarina sp. DW003]MDE5421376.1 chemotaxis protein CheB [Ancylomarina sp. DW003]
MYKALVIGTSFGGLEALKAIIPLLPKDFPLAVIAVLHIGDNQNDSFIRYLNDISQLEIKEAEEKEAIYPGKVYFAPPNYHLLIEGDETVTLSTESKVHHSRPSIDVLFETAAWCYRDQLIGLVLSGLNQDGAYGLLQIKELGGICIVEDPDNAIARIMPSAAHKIAKPQFIIPLHQIADKIITLINTQS